MNVYAFDTETVDGEPLTIQFAGPEGAWLHRVSRETILSVLLEFLATKGDEFATNLLFAHQLEFDVGVVFIEHSEIWRTDHYHRSCEVGNGTCVDLDFRHAASPHHRLTIGHRRWLLIDTMNFF